MANIARLTMFALLTALENDMRVIIQQIIDFSGTMNVEIETIIPKLIQNKAKIRLEKIDNDCQEIELADLVDYLDFQESIEIIIRNREYLPSHHQELFTRELVDSILEITPIRNRVMHSRPLEYSDFPDIGSLCKQIFRNDKRHKVFHDLWEISEAIRKDPGVSLRYSLPDIVLEDDTIHNNLPLPDFDDTGYIGRKDLIDQIVGLCKGAYPVISILGDGGIGKTALALKVAYQIVDDSEKPFDAVIWTSSKTTQLNSFELQEIDGAIKSSLELFTSISANFTYEAKDPVENILEYLSLFRILLIIDNLETIIDASISAFLEKLPKESKVLITSRIGLGRFEYPVFVKALNSNDSIRLLRNYAKNRGVSLLHKAEEKLLRSYCERMNSNPGYIKQCSQLNFDSGLNTPQRTN